MPLDLERDEESQPANIESDDWFDTVWLQDIRKKVSRSLSDILELEYEIIISCTDLSPEVWIQVYWKKFRDIMDKDSSWTISQIKRKLYVEK